MKRLLTAALALSLLGGTAATAQPDRHDDHGYSQGYDQHGSDRSREVHQRNDERHAQHNWARGQRLPATYYQDHRYYVDYRSHHLSRPPHGYQWVQADNTYALVALTTGLIASIAYANH